jgi:hypothetical protein
MPTLAEQLYASIAAAAQRVRDVFAEEQPAAPVPIAQQEHRDHIYFEVL